MLRILLLSTLFMLFTGATLKTTEAAELPLPKSVQIHGFLSQGLINTSANKFFGNSEDNVSPDFRELGINGSWRPLPDLQFSTQIVSRRAGAADDDDLRVDYGLVDYSFLSDEENLWGLRLGRIVNPIGLYNDTRDVAFTRPSILLPQSIYFDSARNLLLSGDGGQIYGERRTEFGDFFLQLGAGYPRVDDPETEQELFLRKVPGDLQSRLSYLGRLLYEKDGGRLRLGLSGLQVNLDYDRSSTDPLRNGEITFSALIFSAQYNAEKWSLTGEYALRNFDFENFGPALPDNETTGESYYLQGTYRFSPKWEAVLRYDVLYRDRDDRDGKDLRASTRGQVPRHRGFAKDLTAGLRWDITPSFMLRAEAHFVDGTAWLPVVDNPDLNDTQRRWNLYTIMASFRF